MDAMSPSGPIVQHELDVGYLIFSWAESFWL